MDYSMKNMQVKVKRDLSLTAKSAKNAKIFSKTFASSAFFAVPFVSRYQTALSLKQKEGMCRHFPLQFLSDKIFSSLR